MTRVFRSIWSVLAWLFLIGIPVQFYLAGHGAFSYHLTAASGRADAWNAHAAFGTLLALISLLVLLTAFAARLPGLLLRLSGALFFFMIVQLLLAGFGDSGSTRWIAALHPVNGLIVTGLGIMLAIRARAYLPVASWRGSRDELGTASERVGAVPTG